MSQNPYAATGRIGGDDFSGVPGPSRVSVLAVVALVCGILGCVPGLSLLAVIIGLAAIFLIAASKGRVRGTGLAIGGVVLGLIFTGIYVVFAIGAVSAAQEFNTKVIVPAQAGIQAIEKGDRATLRKVLTTTAAAAVTDAQIDQFAADVKAEFGAYKSSPNSLLELVSAVRQMGQSGGNPGGGRPGGANATFNNAIPWPVEFEKGSGFLVLEMDVSGGTQPSGGIMVPIANVGVVRSDLSKEIWLLPRGVTTTIPATAPLPVPVPAPGEPGGSGSGGGDGGGK